MALAPFDNGVCDLLVDLVTALRGGERADLGRLVEGVADDELGHRLGVALLVLVCDLPRG